MMDVKELKTPPIENIDWPITIRPVTRTTLLKEEQYENAEGPGHTIDKD